MSNNLDIQIVSFVFIKVSFNTFQLTLILEPGFVLDDRCFLQYTLYFTDFLIIDTGFDDSFLFVNKGTASVCNEQIQ